MKIKLLILVFLLITHLGRGQQTKESFITKLDYLLYLPQSYETDTAKQWPLMIFLHGSGEQGNDLEKVKVHGPPMLIEQGRQFPFIVISPQAKRGWNADELYKMLQDFIGKNRVDTDRIYLTGLSMGGYGTWSLAIKHPEMFAAIIPICGGGNTKYIKRLRHMPVWCFHGEKDNIVPLKSSEKMIKALKKINPKVKFTIYPEVGHDSWIKAYNDPKLYDWMLQQKKR